MTLHLIYSVQIKAKKVEKQHTYQMNTLLKHNSNERKTVSKKKSVTDIFIQQKIVILSARAVLTSIWL